MSLVELSHVVKRFGANTVLDDVSLEVVPGEIIAVIGRSGSGKSTMLRCINGLEPIQDGRILFDGVTVNDPQTDLRALRQRHVLQRAQVREQVEALEDHADGTADRLQVGGPDLHTVRMDVAAIDRLQPVDAAQERALAGAGAADDGHHFAGLDVEVHPMQDCLLAIALDQCADFNDWH